MTTQVMANQGYAPRIDNWSTQARIVKQDHVREAGFFSKLGNLVWRKGFELGVFIPAGKPGIMNSKALSIREQTLLNAYLTCL